MAASSSTAVLVASDGARTLKTEEVIPIPTHMFLSVEGFAMPTAPKPKKGRHDTTVKRLPNDVYDAIQERLPEAWTSKSKRRRQTQIIPRVWTAARLPAVLAARSPAASC